MKRLFVVTLLISFILTLGVSDVFAGAKGTGLAGDILGQGKQASDPHRIFRLVRFYHGGGTNSEFTDCEISKDSIVVWNLTADDGVSVSLTQTINMPSVAGVTATTCDSEYTTTVGNTAAQDVGRDNWVFIQTYGLCTFRNDGTAAIVEGDSIGTGLKNGCVSRFISSVTAGQTNGWAGFAYDAGGVDDAQIEGFIRTQ